MQQFLSTHRHRHDHTVTQHPTKRKSTHRSLLYSHSTHVPQPLPIANRPRTRDVHPRVSGTQPPCTINPPDTLSHAHCPVKQLDSARHPRTNRAANKPSIPHTGRSRHGSCNRVKGGRAERRCFFAAGSGLFCAGQGGVSGDGDTTSLEWREMCRVVKQTCIRQLCR